jgi:predicted ATPase
LFPPQTLLARLDHRLTVLTGGPRDRPLRQQTLRATIDWSYNLLEPWEQALFGRLSVFVSGCTIATAEEVVPLDAEMSERALVLDGLTALVDKSLVSRV